MLSLVKGTAIDFLLIEKGPEFDAVRARAREAGLAVAEPDRPPASVEIVKGEWPGIRIAHDGAEATGGPTGVPWVDSNGWAIRLALALHPRADVWVDAKPAENAAIPADSYQITVADCGAYGGRWIVSLDNSLAADLQTGKAEALSTWKTLAAAAGFFAARKSWADYAAVSVLGVISDFLGDNEFFSREFLNLAARAGAHCRVLPKAEVSPASFASLRAVLYADAAPPALALRKQVLEFVEAGGMLIAAPSWGDAPGTPIPTRVDQFPAYALRSFGKGKIALAKSAPDDPYEWAQDAVVLVSHRYDLVRFWNGGASGSFCAVSPDGKRTIAHLLFYFSPGPDQATVQVAGRYASVKASTVEKTSLAGVIIKRRAEAMEVHLPQVSQYVALEFENG